LFSLLFILELSNILGSPSNVNWLSDAKFGFWSKRETIYVLQTLNAPWSIYICIEATLSKLSTTAITARSQTAGFSTFWQRNGLS
jgi:hypothetical protein